MSSGERLATILCTVGPAIYHHFSFLSLPGKLGKLSTPAGNSHQWNVEFLHLIRPNSSLNLIL